MTEQPNYIHVSINQLDGDLVLVVSTGPDKQPVTTVPANRKGLHQLFNAIEDTFGYTE